MEQDLEVRGSFTDENIQSSIQSILSQMEKLESKIKESNDSMAHHNAKGGESFKEMAMEVGKTALAISGVAFTIEKLGEFIKDGIEDAHKFALLQQQVGFTIKAMGKEASYSVDGLKEMAETLSDVTDSDDQEILSAANLALRFGVTRDQMEKTTQAALDLAKITGQDVTSAMSMLTNATVNPSRAIMMLEKQGVLFSDAQKEQIKTMGDSGDALQVLGMIVDGVEGKYKGLAQANVDTFKQTKNNIEDAGKAIGEFFLPAIEKSLQMIIGIGGGFRDIYKIAKGESVIPEEKKPNADVYDPGGKDYTPILRQLSKEQVSIIDDTQKIKIGLMSDGISKEIALETQRNKEMIEKFKDVSGAKGLIEENHRQSLMAIRKKYADIDAEAEQGNEIQSFKSKMSRQYEQDKKLKAQKKIDFDEDVKNSKEIDDARASLADTEVSKDPLAKLKLQKARELEFVEAGGQAELAIKKKYKILEDELNQKAAVNAAGILSQGLGNLMGMYKHHGAQYKVWAEAKNAVDTALSAQAIYASAASIPFLGWLLAPAAAATAIAAGLANAATIKNAHFEAGTPFAPGGRALVGEAGPEIIDLPRGSRVYSNNESRGMLGNNIHAPLTINISGNVNQEQVDQIRDTAIEHRRKLTEFVLLSREAAYSNVPEF